MSLRHELTLACQEELSRAEWDMALWLALTHAQAAACVRAEVRALIERPRRMPGTYVIEITGVPK